MKTVTLSLITSSSTRDEIKTVYGGKYSRSIKSQTAASLIMRMKGGNTRSYEGVMAIGVMVSSDCGVPSR